MFSAGVVVIGAMAGCSVDHAGAIGGGDVIRRDDGAFVVDERVNIFRPLRQFLTGHRFIQHANFFKLFTKAEYFFAQVRGDDADPPFTGAGVFDEGVLNLGIHRDREIGRQSPRRRRPD